MDSKKKIQLKTFTKKFKLRKLKFNVLSESYSREIREKLIKDEKKNSISFSLNFNYNIDFFSIYYRYTFFEERLLKKSKVLENGLFFLYNPFLINKFIFVSKNNLMENNELFLLNKLNKKFFYEKKSYL